MITAKTIMMAMEDLTNYWGEPGKRIIELAFQSNPLNISFDEFLNYCTAHGGNWGGMLLSGIKELRPLIYDMVPEDMGVHAWACICATVTLMGVWSE